MIIDKAQLRATLNYEKTRYARIPKLWWLYSLLGVNELSIIWKFQRRLRRWEYNLNTGHKLKTQIYKFLTLKMSNKFGIHIVPNCFDMGLKIMHIGSILINSNAKIGRDCVLHINTAMVASGGTSDSPIVGNNVRLGIGSTLIGNIKIGNNVVVGAGSIVTKSFPENHITIAGVPAKIISDKAII